MMNNTIGKQLQRIITEKLKENPKAVLSTLAQELGVPEQAVVDCLPTHEASRAGGEFFEPIMDAVATWGKVTTVVQTDGVILEAKGALPKGSHGHGYFNLMGNPESVVGGHIRADLVSAAYFVNRPFMGLPSMSIQFFNLAGSAMFKIYLGRDEQRNLLPEQVQSFMALKDFMVPTAPCGSGG